MKNYPTTVGPHFCYADELFLRPGNTEGGGAPFLPSAVASPSERRLRLAQPAALSVACQSSEDFEAQSLDLVLRSLRTLLDANPFKQLVVGLSGEVVVREQPD
mgnify:CR=1 FL=1